MKKKSSEIKEIIVSEQATKVQEFYNSVELIYLNFQRSLLSIELLANTKATQILLIKTITKTSY